MNEKKEVLLSVIIAFVIFVCIEIAGCKIFNEVYEVKDMIFDFIFAFLICYIRIEFSMYKHKRKYWVRKMMIEGIIACTLAILIQALLYWSLRLNFEIYDFIKIVITWISLAILERIIER